MAYEILNNAVVTPHRLHAFVRLVSRTGKRNKQELLSLVQPGPLTTSQEAANEVFRAALVLGLIQEDAHKIVCLAVQPEQVEKIEAFRTCVRDALTGVVDDDRPNHLLNLFAAWYAAQGERIFRLARDEIDDAFNSEVYPRVEPRPFNTTKLGGWEEWARFVGWGWFLHAPHGRRPVLVPDAHERLRPLLPQLLPDNGREALFADFAAGLARTSPELDGGVLFERCWEATRPGQVRGNQLSLMLSTGLRVLQHVGSITLTRSRDAGEVWYLYPAEGQNLREVTHIGRGGT
jgi:hypothetical protein